MGMKGWQVRQTQGALQPEREEGSKQEKYRTYRRQKMQADGINCRKDESIIPVRKEREEVEQVHTQWECCGKLEFTTY